MRPDLKVLVSDNSTPTLENCSQSFTDPEHRIVINNSFGVPAAPKKAEQSSGQPRPIRAGAEGDIFTLDHIYISFFSSKGCNIIVKT